MSSWLSGKRWKMQSSTATSKIQNKSTRPLAAASRQGNINRRDGSGKGIRLRKEQSLTQRIPIPNTGAASS